MRSWVTRLFGLGPDSKKLRVVYDLNVAPVSFDFVSFIAGAEYERARRGLVSMDVVVLPVTAESPRFSRFKEDNGAGLENIRWRLHKIVAETAFMMKSVSDFHYFSDRAEGIAYIQSNSAPLYPPQYDFKTFDHLNRLTYKAIANACDTGEAFRFIEASAVARSYVTKWKSEVSAGRPLVSISLREASYVPSRNSLIEEWMRMAEYLTDKGFCVVFVRDTEKALDQDPRFKKYLVFEGASWSLDLRIALYEQAYQNLFVNNGPQMLTIVGKNCPYIVFKLIVDDWPATTREHMIRTGMVVGENLKLAAKNQWLVWDIDRFENIRAAFDRFYSEFPP